MGAKSYNYAKAISIDPPTTDNQFVLINFSSIFIVARPSCIPDEIPPPPRPPFSHPLFYFLREEFPFSLTCLCHTFLPLFPFPSLPTETADSQHESQVWGKIKYFSWTHTHPQTRAQRHAHTYTIVAGKTVPPICSSVVGPLTYNCVAGPLT